MNASEAMDQLVKADRGWHLTFPDGVIEFVQSSAVTGPDQVGGQHFGTSYLYARLVRLDGTNGPWRRPWARSLPKSVMEARHWGSAAVALSAICEPEEHASP